MALRFYRRVQLFPGVRVNLSRSGPSLSVGVRGAHVTVGRRGVTRTIGIPGSGIFWTSRTGTQTGVHSAADARPASASAVVLAIAIVVVALVVIVVLVGG